MHKLSVHLYLNVSIMSLKNINMCSSSHSHNNPSTLQLLDPCQNVQLAWTVNIAVHVEDLTVDRSCKCFRKRV